MRINLKGTMPAWTLAPALAAAALLSGGLALAAGIVGAAIGFLACALAGSAAALVAGRALPPRREEGEPEGKSVLSEDRIDPVTGLANKNGFDAWIAEKSARLAERGERIVVLAADLANYPQLVESRGVEKANAVLKEVAGRVNVLTGQEGIAARIEGEEFAAIASIVKGDNPLAAAKSEAGKLAEMLQRPVELPDGVVWIGGSVGAAEGDPQRGLEVFERAKAALAKARIVGRGHFVVDGAEG